MRRPIGFWSFPVGAGGWLLIAMVLPFATRGAPLEELLDGQGDIWRMEREPFLRQFEAYGFRWLSGTNSESARVYGQTNTFLRMPVMDTLARFDGKNLREMTLSLYNRGDAGDLDPADFESLVQVAQAAVSAWIGVKPATVEEPFKTRGVRREMRVWTRSPNQLKLEWSYSSGRRGKESDKYRPEFIRLRCQAVQEATDYRSVLKSVTAAREKSVSESGLKAHVTVGANGDVMLRDIPMVDQGQKGYCAAATTERVLRYYGRDLDQHEMAQLVQTSSDKGTDPETMVDVLRRLSVPFGFKIQEMEKFTLPGFLRLVEKYNTLAKSKGKPAIAYGNVIDMNAIYQAMDIALLREVRLKQRTEYRDFQAGVDKNIRLGIPLVWSVVMGKIEEQPAIRGSGGHMRLIIGLNPKTAELLYSDSWGPGHELKRMALGDAWTITCGLYLIEPRRTTL